MSMIKTTHEHTDKDAVINLDKIMQGRVYRVRASGRISFFSIRCYLEKIENQLSLSPSDQHVTRRRCLEPTCPRCKHEPESPTRRTSG
jgi:hypothetical protein